jgi:hypothetical protein
MGKHFTGPAFALPEDTNEAENRQALWNQYDSTGQVEGLQERSRMEESPSTPPPCLSPEKPTRVRQKTEGERGHALATKCQNLTYRGTSLVITI